LFLCFFSFCLASTVYSVNNVLHARIPSDEKKKRKKEIWRYIYTLIARILLMIQGLRVVHALMLLKIRKNEVMETERLLRQVFGCFLFNPS
jgi:choline-glycine betaine transporter